MPLFQFEALDDQGKRHKGSIEAQGELEAKGNLRRRGLMVVKLTSKRSGSSKEHLSGDNLLTFTMQLSQLVGAGVPIYESLMALEEQYRGEAFHRILVSLCEQIKRGTSLSDAMQNYPGSFDYLYCAMVAAGEASGSLPLVFERLTQMLGKKMKLKRETTTAMIYPLILASFSLLIIGVLMGFVVPSIEGIFEGRELNTFTNIVLGVSKFCRNWWWVYIPGFLGFITFSFFRLRTPLGKKWIESTSLKLPFFKDLTINAATARFTRTMSTLLDGGLTIVEALQLARRVMGNHVLEKEMVKAEQKIMEGSSLSAEMGKSKYFPGIMTRMIAVGEDTGKASVMFGKIADMYEDELEKSLTRIVALAQPVILILMGGVIGMVMVAILLPLTDMASLGGG